MKRSRIIWLAPFALLALVGVALADGKAVFKAKTCDTCHAVPAADIKVKIESLRAPDLVDLEPPFDAVNLPAFLRQEVKVRDKQHPRQFKGSDEELQALTTWLLAQKSK